MYVCIKRRYYFTIRARNVASFQRKRKRDKLAIIPSRNSIIVYLKEGRDKLSVFCSASCSAMYSLQHVYMRYSN